MVVLDMSERCIQNGHKMAAESAMEVTSHHLHNSLAYVEVVYFS